MTNTDNAFLHAKKLWKKVYKRVFFQDNSIAEKEQKDPVQNSQYKEEQREITQTSEVGSHNKYSKFVDHKTVAWHIFLCTL